MSKIIGDSSSRELAFTVAQVAGESRVKIKEDPIASSLLQSIWLALEA
jgi:hypothetical protein